MLWSWLKGEWLGKFRCCQQRGRRRTAGADDACGLHASLCQLMSVVTSRELRRSTRSDWRLRSGSA